MRAQTRWISDAGETILIVRPVVPITAGVAQPERRSIYYGWKVLLALFFAGFMVYGGGLYCFVLFVPRMTEEFGWSRAATSGLFSAFWVTAPLILLGGWAIKRAGVYRLLIGGIVIEAVCVIVLATLSSLCQMYLLRILMGVGKVMFAVTLPYAISRWFSRHFSLGLGLAWAGWHIGGLILVPLASVVIEHFGWRAACLSIGGGLLTIGLIPVLVTQRYRSPQELGLGLDGDALGAIAPSERAGISPSAADVPVGSLGALLRSPMFWLIALGTMFFYMTYGGLLAHEAAVVEGAGFTPRLASLVLGSTAGFAAFGGLAAGWVLDRYSIRAIGVCVHALMFVGAMALLAAARDHSETALIVYAVSFGITIGGGDLYFVALLRRRFATVSVAYIYSAWYFCELTTLLFAPVAAGWVFDLTGNYNRTLALLAGSSAVALVLALLAMRRKGLESAVVA